MEEVSYRTITAHRTDNETMELHCGPVVANPPDTTGAKPQATAKRSLKFGSHSHSNDEEPLTSPRSGNHNDFSRGTLVVGEEETSSVGVQSMMYSERASPDPHRHMEIRLRVRTNVPPVAENLTNRHSFLVCLFFQSIASRALILDHRDEDEEAENEHDFFMESAALQDSQSQFQGGDFSSGIVQHMALPTGCWTMAFSTRAEILATGLQNRVEFWETVHFTLMYSLPQTSKVSAIQWCPGSALVPRGGPGMGDCKEEQQKQQQLLLPPLRLWEAQIEFVAVAGLDGHVGVYQLEKSLVEFKGTQTIHEFQVEGEVRCMTFQPLGQQHGGGAILAVGDKQGTVTIVTLYYDRDRGRIVATSPMFLHFPEDTVLGLDCYVGDQPFLVAGTKSGRVAVYELHRTNANVGTSELVCGDEIWSTQRGGSVRAVVVSPDGKFFSFGGYDKTLVRVDRRLLAVVRELSLQGTINTIASDPLNRFLVVGCRDKSLTIFDTSTFFPIKRLSTPGWVTVSVALLGIMKELE